MPLIRYKWTPTGLEVVPSTQDHAVRIRETLKRFDQQWPAGIEVAFWRYRGKMEYVIIGDLRDLTPLEFVEKKNWVKAIRHQLDRLRTHPRRLVRLKRRQLALTQADLARYTDLSREQISRIETGRLKIQIPTAQKLAKVLEIPVEDLIEGEPELNFSSYP